MISSSALSASSSTSKRSLSSSTPAGAIDSRTRTFTSLHLGDGRVLVRLERSRHRDAALDVRAEIREDELDRCQRGRDVEHVEVADVAEAEDLVLQVALP